MAILIYLDSQQPRLALNTQFSWNDADQQIDEYEEDDDDEFNEEDVEWHNGDCDDELDESAYTVGPPTDDPELPEQFDGNLEDADASASHVCASASRSFQLARLLLSRVKSARGNFLAVGIGAFEGLAQPSTDHKPAKSRAKRKQGKKTGKTSLRKGGRFPNLCTPGVLPKPPTPRAESRPPMPKKRLTETSTTRGGPHHAPRLRLDQCRLRRQVGHRASQCPNKRKATSVSPDAFGT